MPWQLTQTKQCGTCPWRADSNPFDIPNGYDVAKHAALKSTIAQPGSLDGIGQPLRAMACHKTPPGSETYCVGWLYNQEGIGNNLPLRFKLRDCTNKHEVQVFGRQHKRFEDTLTDQCKARFGMTEFKTPSEGKRYRKDGVIYDYSGFHATRRGFCHVFYYWDTKGKRKQRLYKKGSRYLLQFQEVDA